MTYNFPSYIKNSDATYGPTTRGHHYKPINYHNRTAKPRPGKTRWRIREGHQYEVFRISDEPFWFSRGNNCLFSIMQKGAVILGIEGQRLARFPLPKNARDPWHGWPIYTDDTKPEPDLLDRWEEEQVITSHIRRKIERGAL